MKNERRLLVIRRASDARQPRGGAECAQLVRATASRRLTLAKRMPVSLLSQEAEGEQLVRVAAVEFRQNAASASSFSGSSARGSPPHCSRRPFAQVATLSNCSIGRARVPFVTRAVYSGSPSLRERSRTSCLRLGSGAGVVNIFSCSSSVTTFGSRGNGRPAFPFEVELLERRSRSLASGLARFERIADVHHVERYPIVRNVHHLLGGFGVEGRPADAEAFVHGREQPLRSRAAAVERGRDRVRGILGKSARGSGDRRISSTNAWLQPWLGLSAPTSTSSFSRLPSTCFTVPVSR